MLFGKFENFTDEDKKLFTNNNNNKNTKVKEILLFIKDINLEQ